MIGVVGNRVNKRHELNNARRESESKLLLKITFGERGETGGERNSPKMDENCKMLKTITYPTKSRRRGGKAQSGETPVGKKRRVTRRSWERRGVLLNSWTDRKGKEGRRSIGFEKQR